MAAENQSIFEYESGFLSSIGEQLYLNEKWADFYFVFESDDGICERLPAHKNLLAASNVFETMFNGTWKEKNEATIGDESIGAFKEFLQFFYLARVKLTKENVGDVMNLGNMYNVIECVEACETFMINTMTDENVCWAYGYAVLLERESLKKYCETIISMNTKAVIESDTFLKCDRKILHQILNMDTLHCTETDLFEACICFEWTNSISEKSNKKPRIDSLKNRLGDLIHYIRFGLMSCQEIAALDSRYGIFDVDEHREILQILANKDYEPKIFSNNRKNRFETISWNEESKIVCSRVMSLNLCSKPYYIKEIETTVFSTNKPILLRALCIDCLLHCKTDAFPYYYFEQNIQIEMTIVEISGPRNSGEEMNVYNRTVKLSNRSATGVKISNPILIKPGFFYEVQMKQSPPANCCIAASLKSEIKLESGIKIEFHDDSTEEIKKGLINGMSIIPL